MSAVHPKAVVFKGDPESLLRAIFRPSNPGDFLSAERLEAANFLHKIMLA